MKPIFTLLLVLCTFTAVTQVCYNLSANYDELKMAHLAGPVRTIVVRMYDTVENPGGGACAFDSASFNEQGKCLYHKWTGHNSYSDTETNLYHYMANGLLDKIDIYIHSPHGKRERSVSQSIYDGRGRLIEWYEMPKKKWVHTITYNDSGQELVKAHYVLKKGHIAPVAKAGIVTTTQLAKDYSLNFKVTNIYENGRLTGDVLYDPSGYTGPTSLYCTKDEQGNDIAMNDHKGSETASTYDEHGTEISNWSKSPSGSEFRKRFVPGDFDEQGNYRRIEVWVNEELAGLALRQITYW
jgi:hypothetical protein